MSEQTDRPEENKSATQPTPPPSPYAGESAPKEYITIPAGTVSPQETPLPQTPTQAAPAYPEMPAGYQQPGAVPGQQTPPPGYGYQPQPGYQYPPQGYGAPQYPYPPQGNYYTQTPYPPQAPQKKRVWPWVLTICLIVGMLGIGGCVSCVALTSAIIDEVPSYSYDYPYEYDYNYDYTYPYGNDLDDDFLDGLLSDDWSGTSATATLEELEALVEDQPSKIENGTYSTGIFTVGADKDIAPGIYYLEGSQTEEGSFSVYEKTGKDEYTLSTPIAYFGNYYVELADDNVILFFGPEDATMYPAKDAPKVTESPLKSGCYLVGTDIEPGTYKVAYQKGLPEDASQEAGVYIMKDLNWSENSITESYALIAGGSHTITIKAGEYVELYGATMALEKE